MIELLAYRAIARCTWPLCRIKLYKFGVELEEVYVCGEGGRKRGRDRKRVKGKKQKRGSSSNIHSSTKRHENLAFYYLLISLCLSVSCARCVSIRLAMIDDLEYSFFFPFFFITSCGLSSSGIARGPPRRSSCT